MPPLAIAAGVAAVGSIGGAIIGSHAQTKAANQANASQQQATQAELQLGRESMALNTNIYNSNYNTLSPFVSRGNVAGDRINALLGLGTAPTMTSPLAIASGGSGQPASGAQTNPVYSQTPVNGGNSNLSAFRNIMARGERDPEATLARLNARRTANGLPPFSYDAAPATPATTPADTPPTTTPAAVPPAATSGVSPQMQALNDFANSAGMQFQLDQGSKAISGNAAAHGAFQSGDALKELQNYGQQTALQNYFMPYMGLLGGQQATGAGAASSIAGVGANFGNTAANINSSMGANIQSGANAASNAALLRGQANANMWSGIGSGLGTFASSFVPAKGF